MPRKAVSIPTRAVPTQDDFVNRKPVAEAPAKPMIRLSVDLPEDVHIQLKIWCATRRQTMGDAARALIEKHLAAHGMLAAPGEAA